MENNLKDEAKSILHRITSPWFFTFIPWWVVFNYDFLLIVLGKIQVVYAINHHYCMAGSIRYTIAGCVPQISIGFWHWVFYTPWVTKLAFPILATVFSMTLFVWFIRFVQNIYDSITLQDILWNKRLKNEKIKFYSNEYSFYVSRKQHNNTAYEDTNLEDINKMIHNKAMEDTDLRHLLIARYKKSIETIINTKNENPSNSN